MLVYIIGLLVGVSLGLLGGGGSILTVPTLIYLLKVPPKVAIALSLAIVGISSLIGSVGHIKAQNINLRTILIFSPLAMLGAFMGAKLAPFIAAQIQLLIFSIIMMIAAYFMWFGRKNQNENTNASINIMHLSGVSLFVGTLTGIIGVGGGFMIVPALVLLAHQPMKMAVGSSLIIIAVNSLTGFAGYVNTIQIDWELLMKFSAFTTIGIFLGSYFVKFISQEKLKKLFAVFLVAMGLFIIYKNNPF